MEILKFIEHHNRPLREQVREELAEFRKVLRTRPIESHGFHKSSNFCEDAGGVRIRNLDVKRRAIRKPLNGLPNQRRFPDAPTAGDLHK